jgi:hypothetical protein
MNTPKEYKQLWLIGAGGGYCECLMACLCSFLFNSRLHPFNPQRGGVVC